ncbi:hypothetical protein Goshw_011354, partial [Gossypium schwendimanii]|nr:hypothetical protein [Gossypium schwendimanii]
MALVVGKNMTTESFTRTFAHIDLDNENVVDEQIKFVGEQVRKISNALEQVTADKRPHLYKEVMSMKVKGFDDDFLCSVFDYLVGRESEAKAFLLKVRSIEKFSQ